jgi:hypothetical protein
MRAKTRIDGSNPSVSAIHTSPKYPRGASYGWIAAYILWKSGVSIVFAFALHLMAIGGLIGSDLFPKFVTKAAESVTWNMQQFVTSVDPKSYQDIAEILVWSFIAGYSEKFVPNLIGRLLKGEENGGRTGTCARGRGRRRSRTRWARGPGLGILANVRLAQHGFREGRSVTTVPRRDSQAHRHARDTVAWSFLSAGGRRPPLRCRDERAVHRGDIARPAYSDALPTPKGTPWMTRLSSAIVLP